MTFVGRSCTLDGLHIRSSSHVRWLRAVLHGPEEAECEVDCQDTSQVMSQSAFAFS